MDMYDFSSLVLNFGPPPDILEKVGTKINFKKNSVVYSPGDEITGFYLVNKGRAICITYTSEGNEKIVFIIEEGSAFLESPLLLGIKKLPDYFKVLEDSELIYITEEQILRLIKEYPEVSLYLIKGLSIKFLRSSYQIEESLFLDGQYKVCNFFLQFADNYGVEEKSKKIRINFDLTQQFISNAIGVNRTTTCRIMNKLKEKDLVHKENGRYIVSDLKKLNNYMKEIC